MVAMSSRLVKRLGVGCLLFLVISLFYINPTWSEPKFPVLTGPVVDRAGLLDPMQKKEISERLLRFREKSSAQINIATLPSLQGYEIRDFANRLFRHWGLGQKDKNNGVLVLVAPIERKIAIEVGYGLESVLTDALSKLIIEHKIIPHFKKGDFAAGIRAGVEDLIILISQDESSEKLKQEYTDRDDEALSPIAVFILIVVLLIILNNMSGGRVIIVGGPGGRGWSGGRSGGSWSGGGWSGGGGSSGGGGASGGW